MMPTSRWRHLLGAPAGLILVAATAIACQSSTPATVHAVDQVPAETTYFAQYGDGGHQAFRPRRLDPSVDGSLYLTRVHWTVWNNRRAVGRGIAHVNDCNPSCAAGHDATYRVRVRLTQPKVLCGSRFFTTFRARGSKYHTFAHWSGVGCR